MLLQESSQELDTGTGLYAPLSKLFLPKHQHATIQHPHTHGLWSWQFVLFQHYQTTSCSPLAL